MGGFNVNMSKIMGFFDSSGNEKQDIKSEVAGDSSALSEKDLINKIVNQYGNNHGNNPFGGNIESSDGTKFSIDPNILDKKDKVALYREMSNFPEIAEGLQMHCDEAVYRDEAGNYFDIKIDEDTFGNIEDREVIRDEFDYVVNDILDFEKNGYDLFKKFMTDSELYGEIIYDNKNHELATAITDVSILPSYTMTPVYKNGVVVGYAQLTDLTMPESGIDYITNEGNAGFKFDKIAYCSYSSETNDTFLKGFLDAAIRPYYMLRQVQDSLAVYRLARAPEKRIWNIEGGDMPPAKAETFLNKTIEAFRSKLKYNTATGKIDSGYDVQSILQDYWFLKQDGVGTDVQVLSSTMQLGDLEDVRVYLKNLQRAINIPKTRRDAEGVTAGYSNGKDIEIEELNHTRFIERIQTKFTSFIYDIFRNHMRVSGYDSEFFDMSNFIIRMNISNFFRAFRDQELLESKLALVAANAEFIMTKDNPDAYYDEEFFMEHIAKVPKDLLDKNAEMKKETKERFEKEAKELAEKEKDETEIVDDVDRGMDRGPSRFSAPSDFGEDTIETEDDILDNEFQTAEEDIEDEGGFEPLP